MKNDNGRFLLAIVLSAIVLFAWQWMFPPVKHAPEAEVAPVEKVVEQNSNEKVEAAPVVKQELKNFTLQTSEAEVVLNNNLNLQDFKTKDQMHSYLDTVGENQKVQIYKLENNQYQPVFFNLEEADQNVVKGTTVDGKINFQANVEENGMVKFSFKSQDINKYRVEIASEKKSLSNGQIRNFLVYTNDVERVAVGKDDHGDGISKWFGVDFNYHFFGFVFDKEIPIRYTTTESGSLIIDIVDATNNFDGSFVFLKKNYEDLKALGHNLDLTVDFGFFAFIAIPLLYVLQWLYSVIPNYGVAIIIITLLIRLLLFPLQHKSSVSMKKMQKVQPEVKRIKEKYKDDPQRVQKETMELFKRTGANPMGGCLPLLLQMPIFFAIYKVLFSAVELVDAPFFGWITDLSQKDPYYVLPILMIVVMVVQQKMTPTATMDKNQRMIMLAMPVVFGFIFKDLPSGLVLYFLLSSLFGLVQQWIVYKVND